MRLTHGHQAPAPGRRGPRIRTALISAIALMLGSLGLALGLALPASADPAPSFPATTDDCRRGGWADFTDLDFRNQGQCIRWVQQTIVHEDCQPGALADFQETGPTFAAQLGIPLGEFLAAVCHGQDFPVSNHSYAVDDPGGTDLLSLASGNTVPFVSQPGHIYWIQVQGAWHDGPLLEADAAFVSDDGWLTWANGPAGSPLNLDTQIDGEFVDWGPYDANHHYEFWIHGDGTPINLRVFEGDPATNTPDPAAYANTGPSVHGGMPAIVFEYALP